MTVPMIIPELLDSQMCAAGVKQEEACLLRSKEERPHFSLND